MKRPLNPTSRRKRPCRMPRIAAAILLTALTAIAAPKARADEGMWLPSLIGERIDDMRAKGFRLTAEDIYSVNEASMKDAVVLFNGGCTGELISPEGLLVTNHHCGYGAIQGHSTVEHDYLTHGFWARDRSEELPNEGLWVRRLVRMEEVTDRLAAGETAEKICEEAAEKGRYRTAIEQMYYGNQQFLFVYEQFDDVRLVGAPPSSIGKFGGDTDNWMWPRHTGDFSMFRIYAGKDNRPAEYSTKNVPYRADEYLRLSLDGVPGGIDVAEIERTMTAVPGVRAVHHIHVWAISTTENALTAHVVLDSLSRMEGVKHALKELLEHAGIPHATLEFESATEQCCDFHD